MVARVAPAAVQQHPALARLTRCECESIDVGGDHVVGLVDKDTRQHQVSAGDDQVADARGEFDQYVGENIGQDQVCRLGIEILAVCDEDAIVAELMEVLRYR